MLTDLLEWIILHNGICWWFCVNGPAWGQDAAGIAAETGLGAVFGLPGTRGAAAGLTRRFVEGLTRELQRDLGRVWDLQGMVRAWAVRRGGA